MKRTGSFGLWLENRSVLGILLFGLLVYSAVPVTVSVIEATCNGAFVKQNDTDVKALDDLLYFNFITITTVGYGDYQPVSVGRVLSVLEALWGMVLFGVVLAVATLKFIQPPRDAISFSKYGYYSIADERFLVIFVNTTRSILVNPEMCSYYRQGTEWRVRPGYRAPFIRYSVWTFFVDEWPLPSLIEGPLEDNSLRFGITGQLGLATVSAYVEYEPEDIIVIPNRDELVTFAGFRNADLSSENLRRMFHYRPANCLTLREFVARGRAAG
jgi:Ion channel